MGVLIVAVIVLLVAGVLIGVTFSIVGLLITLIIAGIVGAIADMIVPGHLPFGWLGAIAAGLLGSWLGTLLFGRLGPDIAGIPVLSALIGAVVLAFVIRLISGAAAGSERP